MMVEKAKEKQGMLLMAACALLWSISGVLIKSNPWHWALIAGSRSLLAAGVMALFLRVRRIPFRINRVSITSGIIMATMFLSFTLANKLTTAANAIVIQSCAPVFILLYNVVVRKTGARAVDVTAVALTALGILLFFLDQLTPGRLLGNAVALFSGILLAAVYIITCGMDNASCLSGVLIAHLITASVGLPFALGTDAQLSGAAIASIALLGIVQLGIPYILYGLAVQHCPPLALSLIGLLEAVFNPLWVFWFSGESPSPTALLGGALVLLSLAAWTVLGNRANRAESTLSSLSHNSNPMEEGRGESHTESSRTGISL